jgi:hypothetical protein
MFASNSEGQRLSPDLQSGRCRNNQSATVPNTSWLDGCVILDSKGFIKTARSYRQKS